MPEFKGTVAAVETAPFWDHEMSALMGKTDLSYQLLERSCITESLAVVQLGAEFLVGAARIVGAGIDDFKCEIGITASVLRRDTE